MVCVCVGVCVCMHARADVHAHAQTMKLTGGLYFSHAYLLSVCLSTAPEQITCMRSGTHSRVAASLTQMEPSIEPTRFSRSLSAAYSIVLPCSSLGMPSCVHASWEEEERRKRKHSKRISKQVCWRIFALTTCTTQNNISRTYAAYSHSPHNIVG